MAPSIDTLTRLFAAEQAMAAPEVHWIIGDDQCDCIFQRIGDWNNPYLGRTLRVRLCCIWAEMYKQYPQFVQEMPYYDQNRHTYTAEPAEWDSEEMDMPIAFWHRQLAIREGKSVAEVREEYKDRAHERPKRIPAGSKVQPTPTAEEIAYARKQQLTAAGWLLPEGTDDAEWRRILTLVFPDQPS